MDRFLKVTVPDHPDGVGDHAEDDDVDVPDRVGDGAAEHQEGQGGHHTDCHCPAHLQLAGSDVVKEPEEKSLYETPEAASKHHHQQEDDNLNVS